MVVFVDLLELLKSVTKYQCTHFYVVVVVVVAIVFDASHSHKTKSM